MTEDEMGYNMNKEEVIQIFEAEKKELLLYFADDSGVVTNAKEAYNDEILKKNNALNYAIELINKYFYE